MRQRYAPFAADSVGSRGRIRSPAISAPIGLAAMRVVAAVLLLAFVGPRLLRRHPAAEPAPSGAIESSAGEPESKVGQAAPISQGAAQASAARARGAVGQQILPDVSRSALRTVHGKLKVRVKVTVDSSGNVTVANFDSRGPSRYFAERSLRAAKQWTFKPPQADGHGVLSQWMLTFEFQRSGINVHPAQTFP